MYQRYVKRLLDIILSLAATILLAIPMGIIALWIKADSPGPVFFKQRRVGKGKTHLTFLNSARCAEILPTMCLPIC